MAGKGRSPNFPAFGLKEALTKVEALYNKEGKARIDPKSAVTALKYTSLNGASLRALSALRQYGLLEDVDSDVRLSELAIKILHGEEAEKLDALRTAAKSPRIFNELLQEYETDLPSDKSMESRLLTRMNFNSPESAQQCVAGFRETIEVAKLLDNDYINAQQEEERVKDEKEAKKIGGIPNRFFTPNSPRPKTMNPEHDKEQSFVRVWSLTGDVVAKLEINSVPEKRDQDFLRLCLDRALDELKELAVDKSKLEEPSEA